MKARTLFLFVSIAAALGLAGCFTSEQPLITDAEATAPYASITFAEHGSPDDTTKLTREGKAYVAHVENGTLTMRFRSLADQLYLAESASREGDKVQRLYAVIMLDPQTNTAKAYKAIAHGSDAGQGLPNCGRGKMDMVCIQDVDAYVALAKAAIAAGAQPDTTYTVTLEE